MLLGFLPTFLLSRRSIGRNTLLDLNYFVVVIWTELYNNAGYKYDVDGGSATDNVWGTGEPNGNALCTDTWVDSNWATSYTEGYATDDNSCTGNYAIYCECKQYE